MKTVHGITTVLLSLCATVAVAAPATGQLVAPVAAAATARGGGGGWDRDIDVRCGSVDYKYRLCQVDPGRSGSVRLVRQVSKTACVEGRSWGWNRGGVWVNQGCDGVFRVQRRGDSHAGGGDWRPGPDWNKAIRVRCESNDYRYRMCQVDTGRGSDVRINRQISKTACIEGRSWGWNRAGIWVDQGCAAEFIVNRRWR